VSNLISLKLVVLVPTPDHGYSTSSFHVGYRVLDLEFKVGDREKTLTVAVWYPTAQLPKKHFDRLALQNVFICLKHFHEK